MVHATDTPPELRIAVDDVDVQEFAAVPTLRFALRIESSADVPIRSLTLETRIDVAAPQRAYRDAEKERLVELFGPPDQWGTTLRNLLWTQTTTSVPPFTGSTRVDMHVGCTYDFDVAVVKYFHALERGEIPLEFLFSGSMFYSGDGGPLRIARIPWDTEARYRLPIAVWQRMIDRYFPDSGWLQLGRDTIDRLYAYKASHTLPTLDSAVDALLRGATGLGGEPAAVPGTARDT